MTKFELICAYVFDKSFIKSQALFDIETIQWKFMSELLKETMLVSYNGFKGLLSFVDVRTCEPKVIDKRVT